MKNSATYYGPYNSGWLANIRLGQKCLQGENTVAYYGDTITAGSKLIDYVESA
jgi:hypothetical protein